MVYWIGPTETHTCSRCGEEITFDYTCVVGPDEHGESDPVMRINLSCREDPICHDVSFTTAKAIDPPDEWLPESFVEAMA